MNELTHLDLFAGIGGFSLAAKTAGFRTIAHSEIDPTADACHREFFPDSGNLGDITAIDWHRFRETHGVPLVATGGVPCQPTSTLGQMRGVDDERWLWPEFIRMGWELRPRHLIAENPPSILSLDGGRPWNGIVSQLAAIGYDCWWDVFPAAAFGAGHLRPRVLLVCTNYGHPATSAEPECQREKMGRKQLDGVTGPRQIATDGTRLCERISANEAVAIPESRPARAIAASLCDGKTFTDVHGEGFQGHAGHGEGSDWRQAGSRGALAAPDLRGRVAGGDWWHEAVTGVPVLAHGIPAKLVEAYSRCFGNAIVPQVAVPIFEAIRASPSQK